ncbi:uncharacterized protein Z520_09047 [Fonsecaea multimorphosa CBS 102226]|uniref:Uncharacterized protein n=1 Tax=Fonsecaea multimorphosa CBS 102226 TaxID=1442371 RepID=A0A0D2IDB9_9EURO|nr:uncharacterized protein Z520_09047 [Fonsecaea multimorphosa CBS 102226]KIX95131.1 hypothetical protein Z520_09047 [Fonsecaea multimorphosa CBS 102226]OAL20852.1 hypothetical protein AYO22_08480 [Fonsecaea multimorphosa]
MSRKRRNTSSPEPDESPPIKRQYRSDSEDEEADEVPYFDQSSGQTGAFPGLGEDKGELFYGPANDGVDYLRMVRSEAKGVPSILTAQLPATHLDEHEETEETGQGGYYYDGTYTAINQILVTVEANPRFPPAQVQYYDSLLAHFRLVRATLRCLPPLPAVEALRPSQFISFPENNRKVRKQWEEHMLSTDPDPVQVACMETDTVVELVRFLSAKLGKMLDTRDPVRITRIGAWVWAVLGKCRDLGELSSEEVGDIRGLAQRALRLQEIGDERHGPGEDEDQDEEEDEDETQDKKEVLRENVDTNNPPEETPTLKNGDGKAELVESIEDSSRQKCDRVLLDMIVTIVGEVYGQRDLLDLRSQWTD